MPAAYRVFFRQIGLDPDVVRTPIEAALMERMLRGGFPTGGLIEDVLLIALLDTGVPVWALDADSLDGPLGIRASSEGEVLGRGADAAELPAGRLVVADSSAALAVLFGEAAGRTSPRPHAAADAVRRTGGGSADAVCRGVAVGVPHRPRAGVSVAGNCATRRGALVESASAGEEAGVIYYEQQVIEPDDTAPAARLSGT